MDAERLWKIYEEKIPDFLKKAAQTPVMLRLKEVGMNCGCEYTAFSAFRDCGGYSRYLHSMGVALIVWHFTGREAEALSGLLHDVATPTFAHVIDFLRGDHLRQEATEDGTTELIDGDAALQDILAQLGLCTEDVCDYHRYPIADNDSPKLSADRLEYTLGNLVNYGIRGHETVEGYFRDLRVGVNEEGAPELMFTHEETALRFGLDALTCSEIYVSDADRYSMQILSELVGDAVANGVLSTEDLYGVEKTVIAKLTAGGEFARRWQDYCAMSRTETSPVDLGKAWRRIPAKKRCIDPYVENLGRLSEINGVFGEKLKNFREKSQNYWVLGY